jgi:hypothetical protein
LELRVLRVRHKELQVLKDK